MVKVRMNTADVAAEVKCLRRLIGMRCSNVYDLSPKTYVFKLMNSSGVTESGESEKVLLLMESGVRLHTTAYLRDKSNTPSGFTLKLRKHIRTRRLEDVRQLGYDRIILFQFGLGVNAHYVILELYAQGNILLTDSEYTVLTLLRSHRDDDKGISIMSRHRYPVEISRTFERTTREKLWEALTSSLESGKDEGLDSNEQGNNSSVPKGKLGSQKSKKPNESNRSDSARAKQATLKVVLGEALGYGPALSEHILLDASLIPSTKIGKDFKLEDDTVRVLAEAVARFEDWLADVISGEKVPEGYILMQQKNSGKKNDSLYEAGTAEQIYDEFCPLLLNQFKSRESTKFETFDAALDEFYSKIESQRSEQQQKTKESSAMQKLSKIRIDQESRVHALRREVEQCVRMAELIEYNLQDVDAAILAVRVAIANGMSWDDLARMVKEEKKSGNPVAGLIDKLHLEKNCMTLFLSNNLDEMDDDEKTQPVDKVEVDLALSAHANARRFYEMKKRQESKQEKTVTAHEKAFKAAERKSRQQLSQEKTGSHNFTHAQSSLNEMIVKRYMSKGDLYVHADLHGASSTVIKNHKPESAVPPLTLNQAGCFTVCHSQAWDSKIVTSAWWVYPHQVSKTAPTGEYLTVGSFMIRDESSLGSHLNERRVRGEGEEMNDNEQTEPFREASDSGSDSEKEVSEKVAVESPSTMELLTERPTREDSYSESFNGLNISIDKSSNSHVSSIEATTSTNHNDGDEVSEVSGKSTAALTSQLEDLIDRALELGSATASAKNYGLQASQGETVEEQAKEQTKRDKPYISKAERRKLKKGQKDNTEGAPIDHEKEETEENRAKKDNTEGAPVYHEKEDVRENHGTASHPDKIVKNSKPNGAKFSRGQRGKLKKIKEKYADQDEEERSIRIALLAPAGRSKNNNEKSEDEKTTAGQGNAPTTKPADAPKICYKCKKAGHMSRDCPEHSDEMVLNNASSGGDKAANEMDRVTMEEDDIHEIGEEEKGKLNDVDYLTGNPLPNDVLLYAVPVCGPYSALQSYKYRVKIIPGTVKKGKAAKTAMNLFNHLPEATSREKELMKACTDPELVAAIIGNVKISSAGLTQLKQKQKKSKKTNRGDS
ncbi:zinc knuckle (CCHC-type) family protein [Abeliophyllum distichum]|uniref:Zinc knuckle (CCHC-type) family protein n=1 Tax=Abeliophyllum distichum TaxID=126358 RepID=A0ABD1T2T1_9LAMI